MSDGIVIALITSGSALLLGLINVIHNWGLNSKKQKEKKQLEEEAKHKELIDRLETIESRLGSNCSGTQALLRFELYEMWSNCEEKGFADDMDRENFLNLYDKYHAIGVNGVMDHIKDNFLDLPLSKKKLPHKKKLANAIG